MRVSALRPVFVEFIPRPLHLGTIYISRRYRTASHLCCCGCRLEVVTPLNPAKWNLSEHEDGSISLAPSVGNWSFPCKSHYVVTKNRVNWAGSFSDELVQEVQARDLADAIKLGQRRQTWRDTLLAVLANINERLARWLR